MDTIQEKIPDNVLTLIGSIIVQFNRLDSLVSLLIIELTGNDFLNLKAHAPFVKMQFQSRKALLDVLVANLDDIAEDSPLSRYYEHLRLPIDAVTLERNHIAHSLWDVEKGIVYRRQMKIEKRVFMDNVAVNEADLTTILINLDICVHGLIVLALYIKSLRNNPQMGQKWKVSVESLRKAVSEM